MKCPIANDQMRVHQNTTLLMTLMYNVNSPTTNRQKYK